MDQNPDISKASSLLSRFGLDKETAGFVLAVVASAIVLVLLSDFAPSEKRVLAVVVFMLVLFVAEAVPLAVAGLLGCTGFWVLGGLPFSDAFSGFTENTPWFILGALMIGAMAVKSKIPDRIAYLVLKKAGLSYPSVLAGMILLDFVMTIIIPSGSARVVVLCTITMGIIKSFGVDKKSNIAKGMILVLTYAATVFDKTIVAGAASILARGTIEYSTGTSISWGKWFIAFAPIDLLTMVALWLITQKMFPPETKRVSYNGSAAFAEQKLREMGTLTQENYKVSFLLLAATLLWATDFLHGISAAKICLTVGLLGFVPGIGILKREDFSKLNFPIVVFVGAALSMGLVLTDTSLLTVASKASFQWLEPFCGNIHIFSFLLYISANIFHLFLGNEVALLGSTMPVVLDFAMNNGLNASTIGMIWTFAAGGKVFIYQSAVLALGYSYGTFSTKDLFRMGLVIIGVESLLVSIVVPVYWDLIGLGFYM
ncbi:MAG: putative malate transporter YflS [Pelotomaculum sp. PtaU1.Bin065]|nr:MAG: putative malate transporter YflS [Pelotomaculum sp. PtaU1.Bin065]